MFSSANIRISRTGRVVRRFLWVVVGCVLAVTGGCVKRQLVRSTAQMDVESEFWIRVLLLDDVDRCSLRADSAVRILQPQGEVCLGGLNPVNLPVDISISDGGITIAGRAYGGQVIVLPDEPCIFAVNSDTFRGKLKLVANADGKTFDVINLIPLEAYLAGVIGAEMPNYWEPAALQAQTVAARTYCLYVKRRFAKNRQWDVRRTQANQVYRGLAVESTQVWDAVEETYGQVLVCRHDDGREDIFPTFYSSACGGHTEDSRKVFGGEIFEPLAGVDCPYCKYVAKPSFFFWSTVKFDKKSVSKKLLRKYSSLKPLGEVVSLEVERQSSYKDFSRITRVRIVGSSGKSDWLRAEDLRLTIDPSGSKIKSAVCRIVDMTDEWAFILGRGYGHGVGMCQCGAQQMARENFTAEQILSYYYPGSEIKDIY